MDDSRTSPFNLFPAWWQIILIVLFTGVKTASNFAWVGLIFAVFRGGTEYYYTIYYIVSQGFFVGKFHIFKDLNTILLNSQF